MLASLQSFDAAALRHQEPRETQVADMLAPTDAADSAAAPTQYVKRGGRWVLAPLADASAPGAAAPPRSMRGQLHTMHGQCYGFEAERNMYRPPMQTHSAEHAARPGYDTLSASEYADEPEVLTAKVAQLARMIVESERFVVYAGAGLSTAAGIDDYASAAGGRGSTGGGDGAGTKLRSPLCAQPTLSHRVLVGLQRQGRLYRLVQQNHDGIPQKAGLPQQFVNEIHGALHAPDNPVIPMSGSLRDDNMSDLLVLEQSADLCLAVGTSLAGMNADRVFTSCAARANNKGNLGAVLVGLQRSQHDSDCTLRIFGKADEVFQLLAEQIEGLAQLVPAARPAGEFFRPPFLQAHSEGEEPAAAGERYQLERLRYDAMGRHLCAESDSDSAAALSSLDLRDGAEVAIPTGMHAGALGVVDGLDREGNPKIRFQLKLRLGKAGSFKAPMLMPLGTWWMQAALDGGVAQLPVASFSSSASAGGGGGSAELRAVVEAYAR